jgi:hypothetical protein
MLWFGRQYEFRFARKGRFGEGFRMPVRRDLSGALRAGVRKPPTKEPAGIDRGVCRLWGFKGAVSCARDALAGVVGSGPTIAVGSLTSWRPSTR